MGLVNGSMSCIAFPGTNINGPLMFRLCNEVGSLKLNDKLRRVGTAVCYTVAALDEFCNNVVETFDKVCRLNS